MTPRAFVVLCTVPNRKTAGRISRALVSEKLAACVNIVGPIRSVYRWKGKVCDDPEFLLVIKTSRTRYKKLERRILALHPYEVPEVTALPVAAGSRRYLAWVASSLTRA